MTISEKIIYLRTVRGMTQRQLAEALGISRQSISKWETGQAQPSTDTAVRLANLFGVSPDTLLPEETSLGEGEKRGRRRYFGTDGFRGEANCDLTAMHAYAVGRFLGWYYATKKKSRAERARIVIGKDTRRSSDMLEYALASGVVASGADAYMLHVVTTPGVSFITLRDAFDAGVMITASHNPYSDNGIKVLGRHGEKLDDATTALIEAYLNADLGAIGIGGDDLPLARGEHIGAMVDYASGRNRYRNYLISLASCSYKNLRVGLDCANGASWLLARELFQGLGAQTEAIGTQPSGLNINRGLGSTHPEALARLVREKKLDIGFCFDGDADRCIVIDEGGRVLDGDAILYILSRRMREQGALHRDTVVATVMSNGGLLSSLCRQGIATEITPVGDRFVYDCVQKGGFSLGGEQSGHIIIPKYATTGDGLLTAIMICETMLEAKCPISKLTEGLVLFPQKSASVRVRDKEAVLADARLCTFLSDTEAALADHGRILVRPSGTEPVVRVMVESESEADADWYLERVLERIREGGHVVE